jgi:beta-glucosidase
VTGRAFPDGFLWGTATAAHQVEGGNTNNDWWEWEHLPDTVCAESSGDACDQWHRYAADIELLAGLGFDNYRFSLEWSRLEPSEGEYSRVAIEHYRDVCAACLARGVTPVVTFHHFTTPQWLAHRGGWTEPSTADAFARFCDRMARDLGDLVGRACTINEPNIVAFMGYGMGLFPPGEADLDRVEVAKAVMIDAHRKATDAIKSAPASYPVGLTLSMADYVAVPADDEAAVRTRDESRRIMEDDFLAAAKGDDFLGVQTYSRTRCGPHGILGGDEGVPVVEHMGYEVWPDALAATIRRAWELTEGRTPLLVTENGISTHDDGERVAFVRRALHGVLDCIGEGIDVGGYTYWSLLDNFEWAFGYAPQFGLVDVDRSTQERTVKPSARWLGQIARANALDE